MRSGSSTSVEIAVQQNQISTHRRDVRKWWRCENRGGRYSSYYMGVRGFPCRKHFARKILQRLQVAMYTTRRFHTPVWSQTLLIGSLHAVSRPVRLFVFLAPVTPHCPHDLSAELFTAPQNMNVPPRTGLVLHSGKSLAERRMFCRSRFLAWRSSTIFGFEPAQTLSSGPSEAPSLQRSTTITP
jgi:hypothetical protein